MGNADGKDNANNVYDSLDGSPAQAKEQQQPQGPDYSRVKSCAQPLNEASEGSEERHARAEDVAPGVLTGLREAAANNYPQTQPDPFNELAEEDASGMQSAASSVPRLPSLQGHGRGREGEGAEDIRPSESSYVPASQTMSFDEFKEGPGAELHRAYDELRQHLKTEKGRMREITRMVNSKKAEIDRFVHAISDLDEENAAMTRENAKLESNLVNNGDSNPEDGHLEKVVPTVESSAKTALADQRRSLVIRCEQTKAAYRAIHVEFQLCKKQIEETQLLKKRAMSDIVAAYERLATQNVKPL